MPHVELPITMHDGHILAEADGARMLVDTGSPMTIGRGGGIELAGRSHDVAPDFLGVTVQQISGWVGAEFDILLGMDVLCDYDTLVDLGAGRIVLYDDCPSPAGVEMPVESVMGVPALSVECEGRALRMFLDTGAKLSYVCEETARRHPSEGTRDDFHPMLGEYSTEVFRVPFRLAGRDLSLSCGILPDLLATTLMLAGAEGILGTEALQPFRLLLSPRRARAWLEPRNAR